MQWRLVGPSGQAARIRNNPGLRQRTGQRPAQSDNEDGIGFSVERTFRAQGRPSRAERPGSSPPGLSFAPVRDLLCGPSFLVGRRKDIHKAHGIVLRTANRSRSRPFPHTKADGSSDVRLSPSVLPQRTAGDWRHRVDYNRPRSLMTRA